MRTLSSSDRPTQKQLRYLRVLALRTGTTFTLPQSRMEASREIRRLLGLPRDTAREIGGA